MLCTRSTCPSTQQARTNACFAEIHIQAFKHLRGTGASQDQSLNWGEETLISVILCEEKKKKKKKKKREREREGGGGGEKEKKSGRSPDQGSTAQRLLISSWAPGKKAQIKSWPLIRVVLLCTV